MIKHPAIIRLALHITNTLGKKIFLPHELDSTYLYVMKNLESTLPKKDLDTLLMKLKVWIEQGGSIDFTEKK